MSNDNSPGILRRTLARLGTTDQAIEAAELRKSAQTSGATAIEECDCGQIVTVSGSLRSVTLSPLAGVASVEAEIYDGSGRISLLWMGRRRIVGIEPGRVLTVTGRLVNRDGARVIFNPRYSLRAFEASE